MRLDSSQFDKSLRQSSAELQAFARTSSALPGASVFSRMATDASNLTPALSSVPIGIAAVGAALTGAGLAARRAGVDFEAALAKISTLGPDAEKTLGATRQAILDTFTQLPVTGSVSDLAEANYLLQSSGRSAGQAVEDLRVAAEASVAGFTSTTVAVDGLTTITNAWKDTNISTTQASDVLFQAVNLGKGTFEQIAQSIGLVAPIAAAAGVRFEEVAASVAVLTNQGLSAPQVFEGLRSALVNIQTPTAKFKEQFGELAQDFTSSRLARDGIIKFLLDFDQESGGSRIALRALFQDTTAFSTALGLLKNGGADAVDALRTMETAGGATDTAFKKVNATTKSQEQLVRNQITKAWTEFGELLNTKTLPILEAVARAINGISGGANFVARDVASILSPSDVAGRSFTQAATLAPVRSLVDQYTANRAGTLRSIATEDLDKLEEALDKLRTEWGTKLPFNVPIELLADLRGEKSNRTLTATLESRATELGTKKLKTAAQKVADDERRQARKLAAKAAAEQAKKERAREQQALLKETTQLTDQLQAAAVAATTDTAGALLYAMQETLKRGAAQLKAIVGNSEAKAALTLQLEQFEQLQTEMISVTEQAALTQNAIESALNKADSVQLAGMLDSDLNKATSAAPVSQILDARERELRVILAGTQSLAVRKQLEQQIASIAATRDAKLGNVAKDPLQLTSESELRTQIAQLGDLAQSIATVGDQLGVLPRRAVDALRGIGALAEQGSKLASSFGTLGALGQVGALVGIAGGIASLAAGLFGESPEDKARREELRKNTEALKKLSDHIGDLSTNTTPGNALAGARRGIEQVLKETGGDYPGSRLEKQYGDLRGLIANRGGITLSQLDQAISSTGVGLQRNVQSLQQLLQYFSQADPGAYVDDFAGAMQRLDDTIRVDGVTDSVELLRRRIAVLTSKDAGFPALATALEGLDLSSVDDRNTALERTRALFDQVANGKLSLADLGNLSVPEAKQAIIDLITQLRDSVSGSSVGTGGFNETRSITEVTGSRLAGLLGSANTYLSAIALDVAALRSAILVAIPSVLAPPPVGSLGRVAGGVQNVFGPNSIVVSVTLTRELLGADAGSTIAAGQLLGTATGRALAENIDRQLNENALRRKLLQGDTALR